MIHNLAQIYSNCIQLNMIFSFCVVISKIYFHVNYGFPQKSVNYWLFFANHPITEVSFSYGVCMNLLLSLK